MTVKRQTTVAFHAGVSADPGDDTALVDGLMADLTIDMKALTGTSVLAEAKEVVDIGWTLPYDGQTANFTVGATLTGYAFDGGGRSVTALIVADADGGATGTLTLTNVSGKFVDDMIIVDDGGTPGKAIVNSTTGGTRSTVVGATWASVLANAVERTSVPFENPGVTAGLGDQRHVTPREFVIEYTFSAVTTADYSMEVMQIM